LTAQKDIPLRVYVWVAGP